MCLRFCHFDFKANETVNSRKTALCSSWHQTLADDAFAMFLVILLQTAFVNMLTELPLT